MEILEPRYVRLLIDQGVKHVFGYSGGRCSISTTPRHTVGGTGSYSGVTSKGAGGYGRRLRARHR